MVNAPHFGGQRLAASNTCGPRFFVSQLRSRNPGSQLEMSRLLPLIRRLVPKIKKCSLRFRKKRQRLSFVICPSAFGNSSLTEDSKRAIETSFRGRFRCHVLGSPEDFYAECIVVVDAVERLQEAGQIDDTFTG